jgi:hypothetical protein
MPTYEQTPVSGVEYPRAYAIEINNRYGVTPSVTFHLEALTLLGDRTLSRGLPSVTCEFDPEAIIPILGTDDGTPTGDSVTHADLYQILFSLCEQLRANYVSP